MEIYQIRYFVTVVESGGFSRAGAILKVTQASITRGIWKLEREVGPLLTTKTRGRLKERTAKTTELGEVLLPRFQTLLQMVGNIRDASRLYRRPGCNEDATWPPAAKKIEDKSAI